jgi:ABC-2 type transport system ATP-binding protein
VGVSPAVSTRPPDLAVRCVGLVKRYPDVVAVDGLDLEVERGECFGLLGPNGAGKTTTVEILEGLTAADAGEVEVLGRRWGTGQDHEIRRRLGIQLQETQLGDKLTVAETVRLFRSFYESGPAVAEVVATTGLEDKQKARVGKLSGGQRQRLALACALVSDPELLFLDEPTTGLDPQARRHVWEVVESFLAAGGTVVLTTHYMEEAARLCHRIAIVDHGRRIALGTPAELVAALGAEQILEVRADGALDEGRLTALPGVAGVTARNGGWMIRVSEVAAALPAVLAELDQANAPLVSLTTHQASLEDVFVHLTGRCLRDD